jgi:uncharacterized protein (TIGR02598 family)
MIIHSYRHHTQRRGAFTLVEVALAVAVIGVSLLAVVGLLPSLLETERESAFRSMVPKLRAQALAELRAKPYPTTLPHTEVLFFTEGGEVTTDPVKAVYKCQLALAVPTPSPDAANGGIPDLKSNFCVVKLTCNLTSEPAGTSFLFHESLAKER